MMSRVVRTPRDLGAVVRRARTDRGWSQAELAGRARLSRQWVSDVERGKRTAEVGLVLRTLHTLGLELAVDTAVAQAAGFDLDDLVT